MRLTPRVLVRSDVLAFSKVSRARVLRGIQIAGCYGHPVRCASVTVPAMIVRTRWEDARKWIHPGARADSGLTIVQAGAVRIGAAWAQVGAGGATASVTAKAALVIFQREECMLSPGLADLFEAIVIVSPAAHPIKILRNERVIGVRQCEPVQWLVAIVTGSRSHTQSHKMIYRIVSTL